MLTNKKNRVVSLLMTGCMVFSAVPMMTSVAFAEEDLTPINTTTSQNDGNTTVKELTSISVTKAPAKTEYKVGENFDKTGMEITAQYSDSTSAPVTDYTVTDGEKLTAGKTSVTISFTEGTVTQTTTQTIVVKEAAVENGNTTNAGATSSYLLIFNSNGGSSISQISNAEAGKIVQLGSYVPTREGYQFEGWFSDEDLTVPVSSVTVNEKTIVYAKWTRYSLLPFADVDLNSWFYDNVKYVYENNLMMGTDGTHFSPSAATSRGMIVTILYRMDGSQTVGNTSSFSDVNSGDYYSSAVAWAVNNKIVLGYQNGSFGANDPITREQLSAVLYRYSEYKNYDIRFGDKSSLDPYADTDTISEYAVPSMNWACGEGLLNGTLNKELLPKAQAQRCEVAAILERYLEDFVKTEPKEEV